MDLKTLPILHPISSHLYFRLYHLHLPYYNLEHRKLDMFTKYSTFMLALLSASATAKLLADFVPQLATFEERSARTAGGFSLVAPSTCPPATQACGDNWCCPIGLECIARGDDTGNVVEPCCPEGKISHTSLRTLLIGY